MAPLSTPVSGDTTHSVVFNSVAASGNYSGIAAVLAGFAFAGFIMIVDRELGGRRSHLGRSGTTLVSWVASGLIVSMFGSVVAALNFGVLGGMPPSSPAIHLVVFVAGAAFSLSTTLLFWTMFLLSRTLLSRNADTLSRMVLLMVGIGADAFLVSSSSDYARSMNRLSVRWDIAVPGLLGAILVIGPTVLRSCGIQWVFGSGRFAQLMGVSYSIAIVIATLAVLWISSVDDVAFVGGWLRGGFVVFQCASIGMISASYPHRVFAVSAPSPRT